MNLQEIKNILREKFPFLYDVLLSIRKFPLRIFVWRRLMAVRKAQQGISVLYLTEEFPAPPPTRREYAHGGTVKMTFLAETFFHSFPSANLLYTVSSVGHRFSPQIVKEAKRKGLKVVVNQNGVAYPAWHGEGWEKTNQPMRKALEQADYVIYQSDFCRQSANHFLISPEAGWEILFNPVETQLFKPLPSNHNTKAFTLILGGNQYERYRFEMAIVALKEVVKQHPDARLIVTGKLWDPDPGTEEWVRTYLNQSGLFEKVEFTGPYTQQEAPEILNKGHILLHTKFNDPCPSIVIEALSCGLPVVYLDSGGTPELVGEAGVGVPVQTSWEKNELPAPKLISDAVDVVMDNHEEYSQAARQRAMDVFTLEKYVQAHYRIFEKLLDAK